MLVASLTANVAERTGNVEDISTFPVARGIAPRASIPVG